jgi:hypothetical protein
MRGKLGYGAKKQRERTLKALSRCAVLFAVLL